MSEEQTFTRKAVEVRSEFVPISKNAEEFGAEAFDSNLNHVPFLFLAGIVDLPRDVLGILGNEFAVWRGNQLADSFKGIGRKQSLVKLIVRQFVIAKFGEERINPILRDL